MLNVMLMKPMKHGRMHNVLCYNDSHGYTGNAAYGNHRFSSTRRRDSDMSKLLLIGAYGRIYTDLLTMLKDWQEGKDFQIYDGPYCSIRDIPYLIHRYDTAVLMAHNGATVTVAQYTEDML